MTASWLLDHLAAQRWYGANDRTVVGARFLAREPVAPGIDWALLHLHFQPGPNTVYQVFLDETARRDVAERPEVVRWLFPQLAAASVRPMEGEQSNTSVVCDSDVIVKIFRRVPREPNPDVAIVDGLWRVGYRSVPEPLGSFSRDGRDLAVARRFLRGSVDGWRLALEDDGFPALAGSLGTVTGELHVALGQAFGAGSGDGRAWAAAMQRQLARVEVPAGLDVDRVYRRLAQASGGVGASIRVHGDYHLGQVLRWRDGWYVLDFEGEPARPMSERVVPSSPLRDVAGMLRSFNYAAVVAGRPAGWEDEVRQRFLHGYLAVPGVEELVGGARHDAVLAAFELDKAVYELAYERANRPEWAAVPLSALERLAAQAIDFT